MIAGKVVLELARYFIPPLILTTIKILSMITNLNLDEMILQYSENPFIEDKMIDPAVSDNRQKQKVLSRLLFVASNLFIKAPVKELNSYKRRYEIQ